MKMVLDTFSTIYRIIQYCCISIVAVRMVIQNWWAKELHHVHNIFREVAVMSFRLLDPYDVHNGRKKIDDVQMMKKKEKKRK